MYASMGNGLTYSVVRRADGLQIDSSEMTPRVVRGGYFEPVHTNGVTVEPSGLQLVSDAHPQPLPEWEHRRFESMEAVAEFLRTELDTDSLDIQG